MPQPLDIAHAPEPPHDFLKGERLAGRIDGDHFSVEDGVAVAEALSRLGDLGQAGRDLVEPARKDSHAAGRVMDLYARAIDLVLDGEARAQNRECVGDRARRLREHRAQRPCMRDAVGGGGREGARRRPSFAGVAAAGAGGVAARSGGASRCGAPAGAACGDVGRLAQELRQPSHVALQHMHPAHFVDRPPGHLRQRFQQQTLAHPMAHLANQHLGRVLRFQRGHPREKLAQPLELAPARAASLDFRDLLKRVADLGERQGWFGLVAPKPHHHLDRLAEVGRGGEDVFALVLTPAKLGGDFPYRAAAHVEPRLAALFERAANHETRGDRGLRGCEPGEEIRRERGYLEAAMSLAERLADLGEIEEGTHRRRLDSLLCAKRNTLFHRHSRRASDVGACAPPVDSLTDSRTSSPPGLFRRHSRRASDVGACAPRCDSY